MLDYFHFIISLYRIRDIEYGCFHSTQLQQQSTDQLMRGRGIFSFCLPINVCCGSVPLNSLLLQTKMRCLNQDVICDSCIVLFIKKHDPPWMRPGHWCLWEVTWHSMVLFGILDTQSNGVTGTILLHCYPIYFRLTIRRHRKFYLVLSGCINW